MKRWSLSNPFVVTLIASAGYLLVALHYGVWSYSPFNYYAYLADAFLHGQLYLRQVPQETLDLVLFNGRYFLYWPPFPALVFMPLVAAWGVQVSDILLTLIVGAINAGLAALLLNRATEKGLLELSSEQIGALALFFAFGTMHLPLAVNGQVWFTAQVIGFGLVCLAYLAAISLEGWSGFFFMGLFMALALLTRNNLALVGLWPAYELLRRHWKLGARRIPIMVGAGALPMLAAVFGVGAYNYARFGNPFDLGLAYHQVNPFFASDFARYGAFNIYYLPTNLYYQFLFYPLPWRSESLMGGGLFLMSPVFLGLFWGVRRNDRSSWVLLATCLLAYIPIGLLMGTGWKQFGPRYLLDIAVPLLLLTAKGVSRWPLWLLYLLTLVSIATYLVGVL